MEEVTNSRLSPNFSPRVTRASQQQQQRSFQTIGNYEIGKTVGKGQFGKVKIARHIISGEKVAIKIVRKSLLDQNGLKLIRREINIMKLLNHKYIIQLYEILETERYFFLIMEYAGGGEILDTIVAHRFFEESQAVRYFYQIVQALQYCHSNRVVHRDLKAENLLLDSDRNIKIIDFGLSNMFKPGDKLKTFCGSPTYAAPELIQKQEYCGPEVDVWSLGVVLYVFVCGHLPFNGHDFLSLFTKILNADYKIPETVSPACRSLIARMLVVDPEERATLEEVANHPWVQCYLESNKAARPEPVPNAPTTNQTQAPDPLTLLYMERLGYSREPVLQALRENQYNSVAATYYLLSKKLGSSSYSSSAGILQHSESAVGLPPATSTTPKISERPHYQQHRRTRTMDSSPISHQTPPSHHNNPPPPVSPAPSVRIIPSQLGQKSPVTVLVSSSNTTSIVPVSSPNPSGHTGPLPQNLSARAVPASSCRLSPPAQARQGHRRVNSQDERKEKAAMAFLSRDLSTPTITERDPHVPAASAPSGRGLTNSSPTPQHHQTQPQHGHIQRLSPRSSISPASQQNQGQPRQTGAGGGHRRNHSIAGPGEIKGRLERIEDPNDIHWSGSSPPSSTSTSARTSPVHSPGSLSPSTSSPLLPQGSASAYPLDHSDLDKEKNSPSTFRTFLTSMRGLFVKKDKRDGQDGALSPKADKKVSPRPVRSVFSKTSSRAPEHLVGELHSALATLEIPFHHVTPFCLRCTPPQHLSITPLSPRLSAPESIEEEEPLQFELEVCRVPGLTATYFVRAKRIQGSWNNYNSVYNHLFQQLKL